MKFVKFTKFRHADVSDDYPQISLNINADKVISVYPNINYEWDSSKQNSLFLISGTNIDCGPDAEFIVVESVDEVVAALEAASAQTVVNKYVLTGKETVEIAGSIARITPNLRSR